MENKKKTLTYIVLMQIIGCLLVIFGHSYPFVSEVPNFLIDIRTFVYYFHMPLFVWCSGFLFVYTEQVNKRSFGQFCIVRAKRLIVPYFALSVIGFLPKILLSKYLNDSLTFELVPILRVFFVPRENVWGHFWFLPMIFFIGLIGFGIQKSAKGARFTVLISVVCMVAFLCLSFFSLSFGEWLGINDVLKYSWIYLCGMTTAMFYEKKGCSFKRFIDVFVALLAFAIAVALFVLFNTNGVLQQIREDCIAILMIVSVVFLCKSFDKVNVSRQSLIAQTYSIFILSWPCQLIVEIVFERILNFPWFALLPCIFAAGLILPIVIIWLTRKFENRTKIKFISILLGM